MIIYHVDCSLCEWVSRVGPILIKNRLNLITKVKATSIQRPHTNSV